MSQENSTNKTNESYQLKDINSKTDETTPLTKHEANENNVDNVAKETSGLEEKLELEKDAEAAAQANKRKTITIRINPEELLQNRNIRIIIGVGCFILLLLSILVILTLLSVWGNNDDTTYRFIRIVPKPRGPTNLIYYRHGDLKKESGIRSWKDMVKEIDEFLAPYRKPVNTTLCMVNSRDEIPEGQVCLFDLITIPNECLNPDYGYMSGSPCIFIVFNNIPDWTPSYGNQTEITKIVDLECTTNTQFDAENIGPMDFSPFQGFQSIYFPYKHQPNYMAPFVALRLPSPTHNVGIGLTCRFVAPNIQTNDSTQEPVPYIPFNIYIE